jgi:hypothetical protein
MKDFGAPRSDRGGRRVPLQRASRGFHPDSKGEGWFSECGSRVQPMMRAGERRRRSVVSVPWAFGRQNLVKDYRG